MCWETMLVGDVDADELLADGVEAHEDEVNVDNVEFEDMLVVKVELEEVEAGCRHRVAHCAAATSR